MIFFRNTLSRGLNSGGSSLKLLMARSEARMFYPSDQHKGNRLQGGRGDRRIRVAWLDRPIRVIHEERSALSSCKTIL